MKRWFNYLSDKCGNRLLPYFVTFVPIAFVASIVFIPYEKISYLASLSSFWGGAALYYLIKHYIIKSKLEYIFRMRSSYFVDMISRLSAQKIGCDSECVKILDEQIKKMYWDLKGNLHLTSYSREWIDLSDEDFFCVKFLRYIADAIKDMEYALYKDSEDAKPHHQEMLIALCKLYYYAREVISQKEGHLLSYSEDGYYIYNKAVSILFPSQD